VAPDSLNPDLDTDSDLEFQVNPDTDTDTDPDPIQIQGFDDQKMKEKIQWNFFISFFDQILQFNYVQATGEAFSPQKSTSCTSKNEIYLTFFSVCG
jgi:hypothetical protein